MSRESQRGRAESMRHILAERDAVRRALRQRDEMMIVASHELRGPLQAITLACEQLAATSRIEEAHLLAKFIRRSAERAARLLSDLLDVGRARLGAVALELCECDLRPVCQAAIDEARYAAEHAGVSLLLLQRGESARGIVDPQRLQQVLSNLLSNAIRHTPSGGRVQLLLAAAPDSIEMIVEDTGSGIHEDDLLRIFDRFYQRGVAKGHAGLGLAIAKELVEAHAGTIVAGSVPGRGACFTIRLPRAAASGK